MFKFDLDNKYTRTQVRMFQEYGVAFLETSAKTGLNVDLAFMAIAK